MPEAPATTKSPTTSGRKTNVRWTVVILLFVWYTINCIDRASLSVALPTISKEFALEPAVQGLILSAFFWTYCLMQIPGGLAADKWGPRRVLAVASVVWGSFTALAGVAANAAMLIAARVGLGAFEAPFMPSASKLVSKWMPQSRRASGVTLIDSGAPLGTAFGGLVVAGIIASTGSWRIAFVVIGVATIVLGLSISWYLRNRPEEHPQVNEAEAEFIRTNGGEQLVEKEKPGLTATTTLAMVIGRIGWAMVFWGLVTWGPSYLANARELDLASMGFATFLIFLCGAVGEILSGLLADVLQRRFTPNVALKLLFGGSGVVSLIALLLLPTVSDAGTAVALLCVAVFFNLFGGLYWTIPGMLAKPERVGFVGGVMNFAGTSAGIIVPIVAGLIVQYTGGYTGVLIYLAVCAAIYVVGSLSIDFEGKRVRSGEAHV